MQDRAMGSTLMSGVAAAIVILVLSSLEVFEASPVGRQKDLTQWNLARNRNENLAKKRNAPAPDAAAVHVVANREVVPQDVEEIPQANSNTRSGQTNTGADHDDDVKQLIGLASANSDGTVSNQVSDSANKVDLGGEANSDEGLIDDDSLLEILVLLEELFDGASKEQGAGVTEMVPEVSRNRLASGQSSGKGVRKAQAINREQIRSTTRAPPK